MTLDELKALAIDDIIPIEIELHTEKGIWRHFHELDAQMLDCEMQDIILGLTDMAIGELEVKAHVVRESRLFTGSELVGTLSLKSPPTATLPL